MITPALSNLVWIVEPVAPKCDNHFSKSKMKLVEATMSRIVSGSTLTVQLLNVDNLGLITWDQRMVGDDGQRGYMAIILVAKFMTSSMKRNV